MKLTELQMKQIESNISIFAINSSATEEQRHLVYTIYNSLTGQQKKPNSCGRCWRNVKTTVYQNYLKQKEQ